MRKEIYVVGYTLEYSGEGFTPEYVTTNENIAKEKLLEYLHSPKNNTSLIYYECRIYKIGKELKENEYNTL